MKYVLKRIFIIIGFLPLTMKVAVLNGVRKLYLNLPQPVIQRWTTVRFINNKSELVLSEFSIFPYLFTCLLPPSAKSQPDLKSYTVALKYSVKS